MIVPRVGKPTDFVDEDTQILREAALGLCADQGITPTNLGPILGIAQQNASRFVKGKGGISRKTANRLAVALSFRDAEQLIREVKAMRGLAPTTGNVWSSRDSAVRMARAVGWSQDCIDAVIARHGPESSQRDPGWWLERIALEAAARRP